MNFPKKAPVGYTPIQRSRRSTTNTVGYRGVSKRGKKFQACTQIGGKYIYIGTYDTAKEAAIAYDRVVLKANRPTTFLNFPDMVHNLDVEPKWKKQKHRSNNTVDFKGVSKFGNKFGARIYIDEKQSITVLVNLILQLLLLLPTIKLQSKQEEDLTH